MQTLEGVRNPPPAFPAEQPEISFWKKVGYGSSSAMATVPTFYWMITMKNIAQTRFQEAREGKTARTPFTWNPLHLFRGMGGFTVSFIPTIAVQTAAKELLHPSMKRIFPEKTAEGVSAVVAGGISAIPVTIFETIMNQQQVHEASFGKTARIIYQQKGMKGFMRGFHCTLLREAGFTWAYLGAGGGILPGMISAISTHSADTEKTLLQRNFSRRFEWKHLFSLYSFKAGGAWRVGVVTTFIAVKPRIEEMLKEQCERTN